MSAETRQTLYVECERLATGAGVGALASVARRHGSLPMSAAAKMLVTVGGARIGTVGGGCLEADVIELALGVAERRMPSVSEHTLNAELAGDYGLTCGGTAVMFIEPVVPDPMLAAVYEACLALLSRGERGAMATAADWSAGPAKVLVSGTSVVGGPSWLVSAARAVDIYAEEPRLDGTVLAESVAGAPRLVVFGGGHVGASVAEAAAFAGWRVTVVDDRPDFTDPARLPFVERALACDFRDVTRAIEFDADTYVVVATRGHQHDALIVDQLARLELRYLGMLGSRRKVALTRRLLASWGVSSDRLDRLYAPLGLAIGADTPREIAISVVAEMIAVRRCGSTRRGGWARDAIANGSDSGEEAGPPGR